MKDRIQRKASTPNQTEPEAPSPVVSEAATNTAVSGHNFANISVYPKNSSLEHQNESQELEPKRNFLQFGQQFGSDSRPENPNGYDFSSMNIFPPARENRTGLPDNVLQRMENAFGHDFSEVRAQESHEPKAFDARAFARGNELHFRPGELNPQSTSGLKMIGHELTHVVQQREGR